jgi:TP901 family phage tail tape measure protein
MAPEMIGQSLKTIFTRMEQIKLGKMFEDDTTTINQVAKSLDAVGIAMMKDANTFRPMADVLDELGAKWDTLTQKQQNAIAGTIAGKHNARTYSNIWEQDCCSRR